MVKFALTSVAPLTRGNTRNLMTLTGNGVTGKVAAAVYLAIFLTRNVDLRG